MFGFCLHYLHEVIQNNNGTIVLIDVAKTPDCGWEGAYAVFDEEEFRDMWEDDDYTFDDIVNFGESANAFYGWTVVSNNHRNPETAERNLRKYVAKL